MEMGKLDFWLEFKITRGDVVDCSGQCPLDILVFEICSRNFNSCLKNKTLNFMNNIDVILQQYAFR